MDTNSQTQTTCLILKTVSFLMRRRLIGFVEAVEITGKTFECREIDPFNEMAQKVFQSADVTEVITRKTFPGIPTAGFMIRVGVETGAIENALDLLADIIQEQLLLKEAVAGKLGEYRIGTICFLKILGWLVGNGIPILQAINVAGDGNIPPDTLKHIRDAVRDDDSISSALKNLPTLEKFGVETIANSEVMGMLPDACRLLGEYLHARIIGEAKYKEIQNLVM